MHEAAEPAGAAAGRFVPAAVGEIVVWVLIALFAVDFISSAAAVAQMKVRLGRIDEIGDGLGVLTDRLGNALTRRIQRRMVKAYPNLQVEKLLEERRARAQQKTGEKVFAEGCGFYKLTPAVLYRAHSWATLWRRSSAM